MNISDMKTNLRLLLDVVLADSLGANKKCPLCGENKMSVFQSADGYAVDCKRDSCTLAGDVLSAYQIIHRTTFVEAADKLQSPTAASYSSWMRQIATRQPAALPTQPVIDKERARRLFERSFEAILDGSADEAFARRRISKEWFLWHPILSFINSPLKIAGWSHPIVNCWLIRVCDVLGDCIGVKVHKEKPFEGPKTLWLPFGTIPPDAPKHGISTLWPPPEWFPGDDIFVFEGELKAARALSVERASTSPTSGAGFTWPEHEVQRLAGKRVTIIYDNDEAGVKFKDRCTLALNVVAKSIETKTI